jgi:hypothetical protein
VTAIQRLQQLGPENGLDVRLVDHRKLDTLTGSFLPGMLLEVTPRSQAVDR